MGIYPKWAIFFANVNLKNRNHIFFFFLSVCFKTFSASDGLNLLWLLIANQLYFDQLAPAVRQNLISFEQIYIGFGVVPVECLTEGKVLRLGTNQIFKIAISGGIQKSYVENEGSRDEKGRVGLRHVSK